MDMGNTLKNEYKIFKKQVQYQNNNQPVAQGLWFLGLVLESILHKDAYILPTRKTLRRLQVRSERSSSI